MILLESVNVKLGCPRRCPGFTCVDSRPTDKGVVRSDVYSWLNERVLEGNQVHYIYNKNLLEHLPNVGHFLSLCNRALIRRGIIEVITDNAMWPLFYVPIPRRLSNFRPDGLFSLGAHMNGYPQAHGNHYSVFTTKHLKNHLEDAGFETLGCLYGIHSEVRSFPFNLHFPVSPRIKIIGRKR